MCLLWKILKTIRTGKILGQSEDIVQSVGCQKGANKKGGGARRNSGNRLELDRSLMWMHLYVLIHTWFIWVKRKHSKKKTTKKHAHTTSRVHTTHMHTHTQIDAYCSTAFRNKQQQNNNNCIFIWTGVVK